MPGSQIIQSKRYQLWISLLVLLPVRGILSTLMLFGSTQDARNSSTSLSLSLSHIHTHPHTQCFSSACCVTVPWECWATFYPWLCPFFQSLYLTSLVLKGISQVRAPVSARSLRLCQRFWPGAWEWTSGSLWASATACSHGIWVHVCFFFSPQLQVGSQSRYETTAPESWRTTATGTK